MVRVLVDTLKMVEEGGWLSESGGFTASNEFSESVESSELS